MPYTATINGTKHTVSHVNGTTVYDPPLPRDAQKRFDQKVRDMCKHQKAPRSQTDTDFHAGRGTLLDQMDGDEVYTQILTDAAKKQGYNPGANDVYIGQLADRKGDPDAWFKPGEGRAELIRRAKKKGKGIDMPGCHVEAAPYVEKPKSCDLNPRIVNNLVRKYKSSGEADGMTDSEVKQKVIEKHGFKR